MKTINYALKVLSLAIVLLFVSCQDETIEVIDPTDNQTVQANSPVARLMQRTSLNDGSSDNIIDQSSCSDIVLPVTVVVNGLEIIIDSEEDFELIEAIFEEFTNDNDELEIVYPITIILSNHEEIVINSQQELEALIADCIEGGEDDDIECIDFQYPITISTYDSNNQIADTVVINSDAELYELFENLDPATFVSLNFPVTLVTADGNEVVVSNYEELANAIEAAIEACDEDDDNDYDDDDVDLPIDQLNELLTTCPWIVDKLIVNGDDLGEQYEGYVLTFFENGTVTATINDAVWNGTWGVEATSVGLVFVLEIEGLEDFNNIWRLHGVEHYNGVIKLDFRRGDSRLRLKKNCDNGNPTDCSETFVDQALTNCFWRVVSYNGNGEFSDFELYFRESQTLEVQHSINDGVFFGAWSTSQSGAGVVVEISQLDGNLMVFNSNWTITECAAGRFKMVSGDDYIIIEKDCGNNAGGDVAQIKEWMTMGEWIVANYNDSGQDDTGLFEGYGLDFLENGGVIAESANSLIDGEWNVYRDNSNVLRFDLNFGNDQPFNELNDDWRIVEVSANRIELKDISGGDGTVDILVFEKL